MNNTDTSSWPQNEPFNSYGATPDEDFAKFLDFDLADIDFNFPIFGSNLNDLNDPNAEASTNHGFSADLQSMEMATFAGHVYGSQQLPAGGNQDPHSFQALDGQQGYQRSTISQYVPGPGLAGENMIQQFSKPQMHAYGQPHTVPPTPNSVGFYDNPVEFLQRSRELVALDVPHQSLGNDMIAFTPLASPAVTPYDDQVTTSPAFAIPVAYFSPLTSPALQGQTQAYRNVSSARASTAESSVGTSPIDLDVDMLGEAAQPQPEPPRKTKKKTTAPRRATSLTRLRQAPQPHPAPPTKPTNPTTAPRRSTSITRIRQSPIVKPQRRKATFSSSFPPHEIEEMVRQGQASKDIPPKPLSAGLLASASHNNSSAGSVSPEPHSATLMGPPPKPSSIPISSIALPQVTSAPSTVQLSHASQPSPVTPASLMKLRQQEELNHALVTFATTSSRQQDMAQDDEPTTLSDLTISDIATAARPSLTRSITQIRDEEATPRLGADKLPKSGAMKAQSSTNSPSLLGSLEPSTKSLKEPAQPRRPESSTGRGGKRKNGSNSTLVSPALLPRISPSIKPLLPDGAPSVEAHALLLATKSNYQNILEGTHVPGVHYPDYLCMNLTSKRTSHKLAEQGRRNRINIALQEMAALLPSASMGAKDIGVAGGLDEKQSIDKVDGAGKGESQGSTSKAATVEAAIDYIHVLREQLADKDKEISDMRAKLEELGR